MLALPFFHNGPTDHSSVKTVKADPLNLTLLQTRLLSGFASFELLTNPDSESGAATGPDNYFPTGQNGCFVTVQGNVKVNQNCLNLSDGSFQGRGQAQNEPSIAANPNSPSNIIAGYNDYRRGDGTCGVSYSLDGGSVWQDSTVPNGFTRFSNLVNPPPFSREYWEASGDTAVAWDTRGNAYLECMVFERGSTTTDNPDSSSAIYLLRSTQNSGASFNFPAHPVVTNYVPVSPATSLLDKPYMTIDDNVASPFRDRIYVTWTYFASDGSAKIYEAHSSNYGQTFSCAMVSAPTSCTLVSTPSPLCPVSVTVPGSCDANQFSQPFVGPDGALYVVFDNYNNAATPPDNRNQVLLAKSTDGGVTFGPLIKVADFYDLPDCATYQGGQDSGRACVPEKGTSMNSVFRATNYPVGGVNPQNPSQVVVTFGSYINSFSKETNGCSPAGTGSDGQNLFTGVKTPGACNNKILLSTSTNGATTFTGTTTNPRSLPTVNQAANQAATDQWWEWTAFGNSGQLAVSYYDRSYGADETTGTMDVSLSSSSSLSSFKVARVTSTSMPLPTEFPNGNGNSLFFGDYSGLTIGNNAQPVWSDTRDIDLFLCPGTGTSTTPPAICTATEPNGLVANDEDIFTSGVGISSK